MTTYDFSRTEFLDHIWIGGGQLFLNIDFVDMDVRTTGGYRFEIYDDNDALLGSRNEAPGSGWRTYHWHGGEFPDARHKTCKLKLVNTSKKSTLIISGGVHFT